MLYRTGPDPETWGHTVHTPHQQVIRCTQVNCTCRCFRPHRINIRSCDRCKHGWVAHAVSKLCVCPGQVEVVHSDTVCDLSALVLMNTQALPVRMKILLDRLFSVLTHTDVRQILHTHSWTLHDYVRGYMLQDPLGNVLDRWVIMTLEDELLTLKQFLRFGETKSIVELMVTQEEFGDIFKPTKTIFDCSTYEESLKMETVFAKDQKQPVGHQFDGHARRKEPEILQPAQYRNTASLFLQEFCKLPFRERRSTGNSESTNVPSTDFTGNQRQERKSQGVRDYPRKARVSCGSCGKTFYDKGTLKIHYNAVHLKIKHRCTVQGCTMVFSSLRSRNRHSANPNPRLHAPALQNPLPHNHQAPPLSSGSPRNLQDVPALIASVPANIDAPNFSQHIMTVPASRGVALALALATPKKKPRKSSTPLKIQRDREEGANDGDGARIHRSLLMLNKQHQSYDGQSSDAQSYYHK